MRGSGYGVVLHRIMTSHIVAVLAFVCARLGLRPNHVSVVSCVSALAAFLIAFLLPVEQPVLSILAIWGLLQLAHLFDCADGLLARATRSETEFGEFLDHTLDVITYTFGPAAVFVYAYRAALAQGAQALAHATLTVGFVFVVFRFARYFAWQKFGYVYGQSASDRQHGFVQVLLLCLSEYQVSMIGVLAFLVSPIAALTIFGAQASLLLGAYFRYFARARKASAVALQDAASGPKETAYQG